MTNSKSKLYCKMLLVLSIVLVLLFSFTISIFAAPFLNDSDKIALFFTRDIIDSGSSKYQIINPYVDTNFGIAIPIASSGTIGFKAALNPETDYTFYEIFGSWQTRRNLLFEVTFDRMNDDGSVLRFGAYRQLPFGNSEKINAYLGPGISLLFTPTNDDQIFETYNTSISIFLQAKVNYHITENLFVYGNGMHDFNLNNNICELGLGFTY